MKCQIPFSGNFKMSSAENITQSTKVNKSSAKRGIIRPLASNKMQYINWLLYNSVLRI